MIGKLPVSFGFPSYDDLVDWNHLRNLLCFARLELSLCSYSPQIRAEKSWKIWSGLARLSGCPPQTRDEFVSLLDLMVTFLDLADYILCEFHGHHCPVAQCMMCGKWYRLVANPELLNKLIRRSYCKPGDPF